MIKPITPEQAKENNIAFKIKEIPKEVIMLVNNLLSKKFSTNGIKIYQKEIIDILVNEYKFDRNKIFENGWLDFEPIFEQYGWKVIYHKESDYRTAGDDYFEFKIYENIEYSGD
jgi:hypothetical protein